MLFNLSSSNKKKPRYAEILAEFYQLSMEQTESWCAEKEGQVVINLPFAAKSEHVALKQFWEEKGEDSAKLNLQTDIVAKHTKVARLPKVKNIIAVGSGKGGVGKSTTSVNLAFALQQEGARVGLLDADIYGPSLPIMLGNPNEHPQSEDQKHMFPMSVGDIVANSIGYLVPPEEAAIWRGPMASRALQQILNETLWPELDYLIVDMPPGTGDIQLTLAQQVPVTAAVIVTTPQDLALADAIKGIAMFNKVEIPVLGVVENMSYYQCKNCGHQEAIFSSGGGDALAKQQQIDILGHLPLDIQIRHHADGGAPLLLADEKGELSTEYRNIARKLSRSLAMNDKIKADNSIPVVEKR